MIFKKINIMKKKTSLIAILCFVLSFTGCSEKIDESEISDAPELEQKIVSFNLTNYTEKGGKKWELKGETANIMSEVIYLTTISADTYDEPSINLTSDDGTYNKKTRVVFLTNNVIVTTSDGLTLNTDSMEWDGATDVIFTPDIVKIKRSDVVATGLGAKAFPQMKKVRLEEDVVVQLMRDAMGGAALDDLEENLDNEKKHKATITCDGPLEIDYENNIAIFNNNVKVDDQRGQIYSNIMQAYLDPVSKSIFKVVAEGDVRVVREEDSTFSERAVYTTADQKIVLLGKPKIFIHADEEIDNVEREIRSTKW